MTFHPAHQKLTIPDPSLHHLLQSLRSFCFYYLKKRLHFCVVCSGFWIGGHRDFFLHLLQKNCSSTELGWNRVKIHQPKSQPSIPWKTWNCDDLCCTDMQLAAPHLDMVMLHCVHPIPLDHRHLPSTLKRGSTVMRLENTEMRELCRWMCSSLWRQRKMVNLDLGHELEILSWSIVVMMMIIIIMKHERASSSQLHSHRHRVVIVVIVVIVVVLLSMECRGPVKDFRKVCSLLGSWVWQLRCCGGCTCPYWFTSKRYGSLTVPLTLNSFDVWVNRWWKFTETAGSCWFYILVRQTECARGAAKAEWKFRTLSRWPDVINQQVATFWILLDGAWMIFSSNCTWQAIKRTREMDTRIVSPSEFKNTWNYTE